MSVTNKKQWANLLAKARRGNPTAQWEVGSYYDDGLCSKSNETIVKPDLKKALHWYSLSANQGDESSQTALGVILSSIEETDIEKAIYWTKKAISQGSSFAAHNLGTIYRDSGKLNEAFIWYNRSVEMGNLDSLLPIALCSFWGIGTSIDIDHSVRCLKQLMKVDKHEICESTRENSHFWLAIIELHRSTSTNKTLTLVRGLLELADKDGDHEQANELLNIIGRNITAEIG